MRTFTAAFIAAVSSLATVSAAPAAASKFEGKVTSAKRTQAEGLALAQLEKRGEDDVTPAEDLEARQIPYFGRIFEHSNFQGADQYHRANIDGRGYYVGDDWNDRISSIQFFENDKKCSYWTDFDWNNNYCYGLGLIFEGPSSAATLGPQYNDQFSCRECSWR